MRIGLGKKKRRRYRQRLRCFLTRVKNRLASKISRNSFDLWHVCLFSNIGSTSELWTFHGKIGYFSNKKMSRLWWKRSRKGRKDDVVLTRILLLCKLYHDVIHMHMNDIALSVFMTRWSSKSLDDLEMLQISVLIFSLKLQIYSAFEIISRLFKSLYFIIFTFLYYFKNNICLP